METKGFVSYLIELHLPVSDQKFLLNQMRQSRYYQIKLRSPYYTGN